MWKKLKSALSSKGSAVPSTTVTRKGQTVPADAVFEAWTSGDLDKMLAVAEAPTNEIDRHFLLMSIVDQTYKLRQNPKTRSLCIKFAERHISEFAGIAPVLKAEHNGVLPRVSTFQKYATLLTEDEQFERAIQVCEAAINYDLSDGTKSGFAGRILRIRKKAVS